MAVNYNDDRFTQIENEKATAIKEATGTYDKMIDQTDSKYNELINATKDYANKQQEIQQQNTNFAIEQINQQKDKAEKDYIKEQKGAYTDYQKATDDYAVDAEQQASAGLMNTGYSESAKISAFTSYQNRYATARESYNQAVLSYNSSIKEAQLKNNATLAEIAFNALKTQLEYSLEGFQYKNTLLQTKLNTKIQLDNEYNNRYQQVLSQINTENSLAEQIRQYNESMAYKKQRDAVEDAQWQKQYNLSLANSSGGSSSTKLTSGSSSSSNKNSSSLSSESTSGLKDNNNNSNDGWISSAKLASQLGLPAVVNLDKVISEKEYEKKVDSNGFAYYRKK